MILIHLEAPMRCGRAIVSDARNHADDVGGRVRSRLRLLRAPLSHALRLPKMTPRPVHVPRRCGVEAQVDSRTQLAMRAETAIVLVIESRPQLHLELAPPSPHGRVEAKRSGSRRLRVIETHVAHSIRAGG